MMRAESLKHPLGCPHFVKFGKKKGEVYYNGGGSGMIRRGCIYM